MLLVPRIRPVFAYLFSLVFAAALSGCGSESNGKVDSAVPSVGLDAAKPDLAVAVDTAAPNLDLAAAQLDTAIDMPVFGDAAPTPGLDAAQSDAVKFARQELRF